MAALARRRPLIANSDTGPVSSLMIANPLSAHSMTRMFSTQPDTAERINRLQEQAKTLSR